VGIDPPVRIRADKFVRRLAERPANPWLFSSANAGPSRKTTAAFYLGESHSALGSTSDARSAYQQAQKTLPNGSFGIRALERLK